MKNLGKNSGLTLIELMVAVLLFVIIMGGIGYMAHMVVPSQRAYNMNALTNDIYKVSYLLKKDLGNTVEMSMPSSPLQSSSKGVSAKSLKLKISTENDNRYVEYRLDTNATRTTLERCQKPFGPNVKCNSNSNDFEDLLSSWDDGYIAVRGTSNSTFIIRGLDADSSGVPPLSDNERNMVRIELPLEAYEGAKKEDKKLVDTKTLVLEFFCSEID